VADLLQPQDIDLSAARPGIQLLDDRLVLSAIVTLASVLDGQEKERLIDASIRENRRAERVVLFASVVLGLYALVPAILLFIRHDRTHNLLKADMVHLLTACIVLIAGMSVAGALLWRR
jgi:hypothetical protein